jgi:hypothetical protein
MYLYSHGTQTDIKESIHCQDNDYLLEYRKSYQLEKGLSIFKHFNVRRNRLQNVKSIGNMTIITLTYLLVYNSCTGDPL